MRNLSLLLVAALAAGLTYYVTQPAGPLAVAQPAVTPPHPFPSPPRGKGVRGEEAAEEISAEEQVNVRVYHIANRSVVNITTRSVELDDFLLLSRPTQGSGSGIVLDTKGHVLTNYHVLEGDERFRRIMVTLFDGSIHEAKIVGSDPNNDLAVLKIDAAADKLHPIRWGDSSKLLVGLHVFAIGNPFGYERTLTTGIISSLNRSLRSENNRLIRGIIQTDAAINPGNSGGPLLNRRGEMIGITTAIIGRAGQSSGIGLAIPSATAQRVVNELIRFGRVIRPDSGIFSVFETDKGLRIARLQSDGPAEKAGLRGPKQVTVRRGGFLLRGVDNEHADVIVAVDGRPIRSFDDFLTYVESKDPGDRIVVTVLREGQRVDVTIVLAESAA